MKWFCIFFVAAVDIFHCQATPTAVEAEEEEESADPGKAVERLLKQLDFFCFGRLLFVCLGVVSFSLSQIFLLRMLVGWLVSRSVGWLVGVFFPENTHPFNHLKVPGGSRNLKRDAVSLVSQSAKLQCLSTLQLG